jgi:beta-lactamase class A
MLRRAPPFLLSILAALAPVPGPGARAAAQEPTPRAVAPSPHLDLLRDQLQDELESLVAGFHGVAGVQVVDLATGDAFGVHDDLVFPQGSAIKIPILLELFRRAQDDLALLSRRVELTADLRTGGSGVLQNLTDAGSALSLEDLAVLMIVHSDNMATNILIDELGMEAVNALSASLGAPGTRLQRKMIRPEDSAAGRENLSTPAEAARIMERIAHCDLPMAEDACGRVREILAIPKSGDFRAPIPGSVPVAWKPGGVEGVATAWGLVGLPDRPYVVAVMTTFGDGGGELVRAVSEAAWEHFRRLDRSSPYGVRVPLDVIRRQREGGGGGAR